ncbi:cadherin-like beta sandwich domain-containing protein, partial [bacterium]|nr:cadherin-like beta sandwich domain-containing protein [bacterium]
APANTDITISDVPTTTSSISVTPTANKTTSRVTILGSNQTTVVAGGSSSMCTGTLNLAGLSETNSITYYVRVESEAYQKDPVTYASAVRLYTITVSAKPAPPKSDDSSASSLTHTPQGGSSTELLTSGASGPFNVTYGPTITSTLINVTPTINASTVSIVATNTVDSSTQSNTNGNKFLNVANLPTGLTIVVVTITPENGDTSKNTVYTINITKSASDKNGILAITINNKPAPVPAKGGSTNMELNETPIPTSLTVNVTPEDPKSTVTVAGATKNADGTWTIPGVLPGGPKQVTISVQSEDQTKPPATYTVNVWVDDDTSLQDLKVEENNVLQPFVDTAGNPTVTFSPTTYSYRVKIPYTMNSVDLTYFLAATDPGNVTVEINGSVYNPTGGLNYATKTIATPGTSTTVTIKVYQSSAIVTNKNATMKTYTVTISKDNAKTDKDIKTLTPDPSAPLSPTFSSSTTEYIVVLPRGTQNYKLTGLTYDCAIDSTNSTPKVTTTGAFKSSTDFTEVTFGLVNGVNLETITVEAEDGTTKVYKFYIICAENKGELTNIQLLNSTNGDLLDVNDNKFIFNSSQTNPPKFEINATSSAVQIKMTKKGAYATVKISPNIKYSTTGSMNETHTITSLAAGDNTYIIQAVSELKAILDADATIPANLKAQVTANESAQYTIIINQKNLDNDATLNVFEVRIGTSSTNVLAGMFTPGEHGKTYKIGNIGNENNFSLTITADPTKATTVVGLATGGDNATGSLGNKSQVVSLLGAGKSNFTITIETTAQDGVTRERYIVELYRGDIDLDSDTTIANIYIRDDKGRENYITFVQGNYGPYSVTIPADVTTYTIFAEVLQGSKAKPQIICSGGNSSCLSTPYIGNHQEGPIDSNYWSGSQPYITYNVIGLANNGTTGQPYVVEVSFEKPSADASLDKLTANSQDLDVTLVPAIYTLNVPFETDKIPLYALAHDPNATIQINFQDGSSPLTVTKELEIREYALNEGLNTITVTVTPQSGAADAKTYQIVVNRAYQSPKLLDLGVLGYPLLEDDPTKEIEVEFDPEVMAYRVNVPFIKEQAEIFATPANPTDLVTGVGVKNLLVGENICIVRVANPSGDYSEYKIIIRRYSADEANADAANAKILEIPQFELDFNPLETLYEYHVTNDITLLTPIFTPANPSGKSNVEYYGRKLHSGENALIVIITAPDGITTKTYVVKVTRDKMAYEVNNVKYPEYTVEETEVANEYKVNIGSAKSVDVDFTRFITPATDNLEIKVISNVSQNPDEIIVTIFDGEETEIVKLLVQSTGNPKAGVQWKDLWPLLLLLIIVIILLILILICVNRDKFGKLAKKANNKQDKKNKKDAKKNSEK